MNIIQDMGIKDLEYVTLKTRNDITLGPRKLSAGEAVLYFQNLQIATLHEGTRIISARGGFYNQPRVVWEDRTNTTFQFSNGTLNQMSLNLLLEAKMVETINPIFPYKEIIEVHGGKIELLHKPAQGYNLFVYNYDYNNIQNKVGIKEINNNVITLDNKTLTCSEVLVDYYFEHSSSSINYTLSRERISNLYSLEAVFQMKDENTGSIHTGLIEMPKVYVQSNINMRMGERADPMVGVFNVVAMPDFYDDKDDVICRVTYVDEDLYGEE